MPPSRFWVVIERAKRRCSPRMLGRRLSWSSTDGCHGPRQLLRAAIVPIWLVRHATAPPEPVSSRRWSAEATSKLVVGDAGSKMNARSLRAPSPLTSPATPGEYACPDESREIVVNSTSELIGQVMVARKLWVRAKSLRAQSRSFGLPAVF